MRKAKSYRLKAAILLLAFIMLPSSCAKEKLSFNELLGMRIRITGMVSDFDTNEPLGDVTAVFIDTGLTLPATSEMHVLGESEDDGKLVIDAVYRFSRARSEDKNLAGFSFDIALLKVGYKTVRMTFNERNFRQGVIELGDIRLKRQTQNTP